MATQGIDVDFWSQRQTLSPAKPKGVGFYSGYDVLSANHWSDFVPPIPLDERYASFKRRLAATMARHDQ